MSEDPAPATPPLEPLREVVSALASADIVCALGGSGLLAALGLETVVRDWDLTTDAPLEAVRLALARFEPALAGPSGIHADHKFMLARHETECIVGFSFRHGPDVIHLPTWVTGTWRGVPVGSPEAWWLGYALMGREEKAARLLAHLETKGARREAVERLRTEPLPPALARSLRALAVRPDGGA
jgi:hypothetical protein